MKKNLPPIGAQINHPDAFFYEVSVTENGQHIVGLFEGLETAQIFRFNILDFCHAARENALIDEYDERQSTIWLDTGDDDDAGITRPIKEWAAHFCDPSNPELQAVLRDCAEAQLAAAMTADRAALYDFVTRFGATYDDLPEYAGECIPALRNLLDLFLTHAEIYNHEEGH